MLQQPRAFVPVVVAALLLTGCDQASRESSGSAAQPVEIVLKADSAASFPHPFTTVAGLRELDGGRVLVSDRSETRVVLADFGTGDTVRVGREGAGPGEYAIPGALVPLPGDSTLLVDEGAQRYAVIRSDGRIVSNVNPPAGVLVTRLGGVGPGGELYFEGTPGAGASAGAGARDSVPVLRWRRGQAHVDTVAQVRVPPLVSVTLGDPGAGAVSKIAFPQPFAPGDGWGVSAGGELLILRAEPFRMERRGGDGAPLGTGPGLRRPAVAVSEQDKEAFALGRAAAESIPWPATKPPFRYGTLRIAPAGEAWIELSTAADDPAPLYGVLRADGTLVRLVRLPEGRRLVGLGRNSLYTVRRDDDDLEWVERYAL
jgi:hypothetical protein